MVGKLTSERAPRALRFIEGALRHTKGRWAGQPFSLQPWQRSYVERLFGTVRPDGLRQYRTSYLEVPRKNGKALAIDTPIPTPTGWAAQGDLKVGDQVFGPDGEPCYVAGTTGVMLGRPCYAVTFSDGETIVADAAHLWKTEARYQGGSRTYLRTTEEIAESLRVGTRGDRNHTVHIACALQLEEADLPIPPYTLGAWLGDGTTAGGSVTCQDEEVFDGIRADGFEVGPEVAEWRRTAYGLQVKLRELGILGDKRIPPQYLRASIGQRLELARGLLDTDGHIFKGDGRGSSGIIEFSSTSEVLAEGAMELFRSLGYKVGVSETTARLNGEHVGPCWRIRFKAFDETPMFKIQRKLDRQQPRTKWRSRSETRQIVSVDPVDSVPVCCIQVDRADGMYLAGRTMVPTHNSTLGAAIALYLLLADEEPGAEIYSAAADREQAAIIFEIAAGMVRQNPKLEAQCEIYRRSIVVPSTGSSYKVLSADAATKHGFSAHGILFDELHAQPNRELWDVLTTSTGAREHPLTIACTTAGWDRNSICWELHDYAERVAAGEVEDPSFLPEIHAADETEDWTSADVWRKANPSVGVTVPVDFLERECAQAQAMPRKENTFKRLYLNMWTQQESRWLQMSAWDACSADPELQPGELVYAGLDLAATTDYASVALVAPPLDDGQPWRVLPHFWIPGDKLIDRAKEERTPIELWRDRGLLTVTPGETIRFRSIFDWISKAVETYRIPVIGYDQTFAAALIQQLEPIVGPKVLVKIQQNARGLGAACQELERAVLAGELAHGGHPILRWMAGNVAVQEDKHGAVYPVKTKARDRIDGIVATLMGVAVGLKRGTMDSSYNDGQKGLIIV